MRFECCERRFATGIEDRLACLQQTRRRYHLQWQMLVEVSAYRRSDQAANGFGIKPTDSACTAPGDQLTDGRHCGPEKIRRGKGDPSVGRGHAPRSSAICSVPSKIHEITAIGVAGVIVETFRVIQSTASGVALNAGQQASA
jgi:hypothetical protein